MAITKDGVTTTPASRKFSCELWYSNALRRDMVQWDYKDSKGKFHTGIARTIHRAKLAAQRRSGELID